MSLKLKLLSVHIPEQWSEQQRNEFIINKNLLNKFGNSKSQNVVENGYITLKQSNRKSDAPLIEYPCEGAICKYEIKQQKFKQKRKIQEIKTVEI